MVALNLDAARVTQYGTMGTAEIWSVSTWFQVNFSSGSWSNAAGIALNQHAQTIWIARYASMKATAATDVVWTGTRTATYLAGSTAPFSSADLPAVSPIAGTGATVHPYQCAMVASLKTARAGASYRGRMYMPGNGVVVATGDAIVSASVDLIANNVGAYCTDMNGVTDVPTNIIQVITSVASHTGGFLTPVRQVTCDSIMDTQRRRRNSLHPAYTKVVTV